MYPCLSGFPLSLSLLLLRSLSPPCPPLSRNLCAIVAPPAACKIALNVADRFSFIKRQDLKRMFLLVGNMLAKPNIRPAVMFPFIISRSMNHFFFLDFSIVFESLLSYIVNPFAIPNIREISRFHDVVDATPYYAIPSVWCCKRDICKTVYTNARTEIK